MTPSCGGETVEKKLGGYATMTPSCGGETGGSLEITSRITMEARPV